MNRHKIDYFIDILPTVAKYLNEHYCIQNGLSDEIELENNFILSAYIPPILEMERDSIGDDRFSGEFDNVYLISPYLTLKISGEIIFRMYKEVWSLGDENLTFDCVDLDKIILESYHVTISDYNEYQQSKRHCNEQYYNFRMDS